MLDGENVDPAHISTALPVRLCATSFLMATTFLPCPHHRKYYEIHLFCCLLDFIEFGLVQLVVVKRAEDSIVLWRGRGILRLNQENGAKGNYGCYLGQE